MSSTAEAKPPTQDLLGELARIRAGARARWGSELIDLARSEPLCAWPPDGQLTGAGAANTRRYPPVAGLDPVREELAGHYSQALGTPLTRQNVHVTAGAVSGLMLALSTLCEPGDEVIIPSPYFQINPVQARLAGVGPRFVDTRDHGWRLGPELLARSVSPRTRALLLTNPVNPTATAYGAPEIKAMITALPPGTAIIADEVYAEYVYPDAEFASIAPLARQAGVAEWVVLRSASKTIGRPGLRVGAAIGPEPVVAAITGRAAVLSGAASVTSQLAFCAGLRAAADADYMRPYRPRRSVALAAARRAGLAVARPEGTYYLWVGQPGHGGEPGQPPTGAWPSASELAEQRGVLAWPGSAFGAPGWLRLSLTAPADAITEGLIRIAEFAGPA
jgi:aspartate aminotransferase